MAKTQKRLSYKQRTEREVRIAINRKIRKLTGGKRFAGYFGHLNNRVKLFNERGESFTNYMTLREAWQWLNGYEFCQELNEEA